MSKYVQIRRKMSKRVLTCPNMSKNPPSPCSLKCAHVIYDRPLSESCSEIIGYEAAQIEGDKIYKYFEKGTVYIWGQYALKDWAA